MAAWIGRHVKLTTTDVDTGLPVGRTYRGVLRPGNDLTAPSLEGSFAVFAIGTEPPDPALTNPAGVTMAFYRDSFRSAEWTFDRPARALSVEQGALRATFVLEEPPS